MRPGSLCSADRAVVQRACRFICTSIFSWRWPGTQRERLPLIARKPQGAKGWTLGKAKGSVHADLLNDMHGYVSSAAELNGSNAKCN